MKVLMVLESDFPPDLRVENEIESLVNAGHDVHIACFSRTKKIHIPNNINYTIHKQWIPTLIFKSSVGALKFDFYHRFWRRHIEKIERKIHFDAIHIHDLPLAKVGFYFKKKYNVRFILDLHENWPALLEISSHTKTLAGRMLCSIREWKRYEKRYAALADHIIVVVEEAKKRLTEELEISAEKISIVSNTLKTELFNFPSEEKKGDQIVIIYGGGVNYHRGLQIVIQALPDLIKYYPTLVLWIAGTGSYLKNLKKMSAELNLENHVQFWGWMKQTELLKKIALADYALIPHLQSPHTNATIPHKLFQYMYAGKPIIASDCAPIQRIIEETNTGIIYRDRDSHSFAEAFKSIHENLDLKTDLPKRGKEWVENKYNWDMDSAILVDVYNQLSSSAFKRNITVKS